MTRASKVFIQHIHVFCVDVDLAGVETSAINAKLIPDASMDTATYRTNVSATQIGVVFFATEVSTNINSVPNFRNRYTNHVFRALDKFPIIYKMMHFQFSHPRYMRAF